MKEKRKFVHNRSYKYYFDTAKIKKIGNKDWYFTNISNKVKQYIPSEPVCFTGICSTMQAW